MIVRHHHCQRCLREWTVYGHRYPDARCPFCDAVGITSHLITEKAA